MQYDFNKFKVGQIYRIENGDNFRLVCEIVKIMVEEDVYKEGAQLINVYVTDIDSEFDKLELGKNSWHFNEKSNLQLTYLGIKEDYPEYYL